LLVFHLVGPDLSGFTTLGWNGDIKAVSLREEITRANANPRRNIGNQFIVVRIILLKDADESFGADDVDTLAGCVEENVVALSGGTQPGDLVARFGIQYTIIGVLRVMVKRR
jgi:hypothetical protein